MDVDDVDGDGHDDEDDHADDDDDHKDCDDDDRKNDGKDDGDDEDKDATELARVISLDVARLLKHPANRYGLLVAELERLEVYIRRLDRLRVRLDTEAIGAEGGGILIDSRPSPTEESQNDF